MSENIQKLETVIGEIEIEENGVISIDLYYSINKPVKFGDKTYHGKHRGHVTIRGRELKFKDICKEGLTGDSIRIKDCKVELDSKTFDFTRENMEGFHV